MCMRVFVLMIELSGGKSIIGININHAIVSTLTVSMYQQLINICVRIDRMTNAHFMGLFRSFWKCTLFCSLYFLRLTYKTEEMNRRPPASTVLLLFVVSSLSFCFLGVPINFVFVCHFMRVRFQHKKHLAHSIAYDARKHCESSIQNSIQTNKHKTSLAMYSLLEGGKIRRKHSRNRFHFFLFSSSMYGYAYIHDRKWNRERELVILTHIQTKKERKKEIEMK